VRTQPGNVELFANEQKANGFKDTTVSGHETVDGDRGQNLHRDPSMIMAA